MKTRIVNIESVIKNGFDKCVGFDAVTVVIGKRSDDEINSIIILPTINGDSDSDLSTQIETSVPDIESIAELVVHCLMGSNLGFDNIQLLNMDGSNVDVENMRTDAKLVIDMVNPSKH